MMVVVVVIRPRMNGHVCLDQKYQLKCGEISRMDSAVTWSDMEVSTQGFRSSRSPVRYQLGCSKARSWPGCCQICVPLMSLPHSSPPPGKLPNIFVSYRITRTRAFMMRSEPRYSPTPLGVTLLTVSFEHVFHLFCDDSARVMDIDICRLHN